jgi:hypothetical protein
MYDSPGLTAVTASGAGVTSTGQISVAKLTVIEVASGAGSDTRKCVAAEQFGPVPVVHVTPKYASSPGTSGVR